MKKTRDQHVASYFDLNLATFQYIDVHVVFGSRLRPCKPHALDLTIANTWVRFSSQVRGDPHNSQIT